MLPVPARLTGDSWAVFLDVDGTLIDIADAPDLVHVDERLPRLLDAVRRACGGALALVSGRSLDALDALLAPMQFPAAGLHGAERRDARGRLHVRPRDPALHAVTTRLAAWCAAHPGTLVEDKGGAVALHYRMAPGHAEAARSEVTAALETLGPGYALQAGKCVLEIKPRGASKARAIDEFMAEQPFAGRRPVFVGDDLTDEDGFRAVREHGGVAVAVGELAHTAAQYRLADVSAVQQWLEQWVGETEEAAR